MGRSRPWKVRYAGGRLRAFVSEQNAVRCAHRLGVMSGAIVYYLEDEQFEVVPLNFGGGAQSSGGAGSPPPETYP